MSRLSPLTASSMSARAQEDAGVFCGIDTSTAGWERSYRKFGCDQCSRLHAEKYDAQRCCVPDVSTVYVHPHTKARFHSADEFLEAIGGGGLGYTCPVCGTNHEQDADEAASCCLWKDFDAAERYQIARLVEGGATFPEAITEISKK